MPRATFGDVVTDVNYVNTGVDRFTESGAARFNQSTPELAREEREGGVWPIFVKESNLPLAAVLSAGTTERVLIHLGCGGRRVPIVGADR